MVGTPFGNHHPPSSTSPAALDNIMNDDVDGSSGLCGSGGFSSPAERKQQLPWRPANYPRSAATCCCCWDAAVNKIWYQVKWRKAVKTTDHHYLERPS